MRDSSAWSRPAFVVALLLFLAQGLWLAWVSPCWHEEVSAQAEPGLRLAVADEEGHLRIEASCRDEDAPWLVRASARPELAVCAFGVALPVMISSYSSGLPHWPLALLWWIHGGNPFVMRMLGLLLGIAALFLVHRIAARTTSEQAGDLSVLALACMTQFTSSYALLVHYELMPTLFLGAAALVLLRAGATRPPSGFSPATLAVVGGLLGLALLSNVKSVLLLLPLAAVAARTRPDLRAIPRRAWFAGLGAATLPVAGFLIVSLTDPSRGVASQISQRLAILASHLQAGRFAVELLNVLVYWSDLTYYAELVVHAEPHVNWPGVAVAAAALLFGSVALVNVLRRRKGQVLAAFATAEILFFVSVSVLLYEQQPSANYAPIHVCFGWATGTALAALLERVEGRWLARSVAALALGALGWVAFPRAALLTGLPLPINASAERAVAARLARDPADPATVVTTIYNHAGVFDALGAPRGTIALHRFLDACRDDDRDACLRARWMEVLDAPGFLPLVAIVPLAPAVIDEEWSTRAGPTLCDAAEARGLRCIRDTTVESQDGTPLIGVLYVTR